MDGDPRKDKRKKHAHHEEWIIKRWDDIRTKYPDDKYSSTYDTLIDEYVEESKINKEFKINEDKLPSFTQVRRYVGLRKD